MDTSDVSSITPAQLRAARALLGWSQREMADACSVGINTVGRMESGEKMPGKRTLAVIAQAFEDAGVVFSAESNIISVSLRV